MSAKVWAAGRPSGQLGLWAAVTRRHLPLLPLPGNPGGAPFERKRRANQEVRGEPLQRLGRRAHFPFLWALGTLSRWDRGTAGPPIRKSSPVFYTQKPPQVRGDHQLSASAAGEERDSSGPVLQVSMGVGGGGSGSNAHGSTRTRVSAPGVDRGEFMSSVQLRGPAEDRGCFPVLPCSPAPG